MRRNCAILFLESELFTPNRALDVKGKDFLTFFTLRKAAKLDRSVSGGISQEQRPEPTWYLQGNVAHRETGCWVRRVYFPPCGPGAIRALSSSPTGAGAIKGGMFPSEACRLLFARIA
jgi:hypothetical protein